MVVLLVAPNKDHKTAHYWNKRDQSRDDAEDLDEINLNLFPFLSFQHKPNNYPFNK